MNMSRFAGHFHSCTPSTRPIHPSLHHSSVATSVVEPTSSPEHSSRREVTSQSRVAGFLHQFNQPSQSSHTSTQPLPSPKLPQAFHLHLSISKAALYYACQRGKESEEETARFVVSFVSSANLGPGRRERGQLRINRTTAGPTTTHVFHM